MAPYHNLGQKSNRENDKKDLNNFVYLDMWNDEVMWNDFFLL